MSRERTLVTGAAGFVGAHLIPALVAAGREVIGVHLPSLPRGAADVAWRACDLRERAAVRALVDEVQPREVLHLAALAAPSEVERAPLEALRANLIALDGLVDALTHCRSRPRLLFVSTGEVYGPTAVTARPRVESDPLRPQNLYAATKAAGEARVHLAVSRDGIDAVIARPFNHTGPGRPSLYAESAFAEQIARIERGLQDPVLRVGNLEPVRDFSDVRDVVAAYVTLLSRGERGGTYNVCSGEARSIRSVLERLLARSTAKPKIEVDPERYRAQPPDGLAFTGDASKLRALGWAPSHSVDATLDALLDAWRAAA